MSEVSLSAYELVNAFESGVLILTEDLRLIYLNQRGREVLGLDENSDLSNILPQLMYQFGVHDFVQGNETSRRSKVTVNEKDLVLHTSWFEYDENKRILVSFNQLDTLKKIIKEVDNEAEASSLLSIIMDAINDCIVYVNKDGIVEMLSRAYAEFLSVDRDWAIGRHVRDVIENTRMDIVTKTGKPEIAQVQEINGRNMIATRIPIFVNGKVVGAVGKVLFRDVDELNTLYLRINNIQKELNLYRDEFKKANKASYALDSIIGESPGMKQLKDIVKKVGNTNSNVLILGESGTGKELFAHAIHNNSKRVDAPFIKVNCSAIPFELLESELFGYEEGSFTGARKGGKIGKFKAADGGTIFLDEIGELPMSMQAKLLRVLQDREIEKIGSNISEKVDVRVIAATNKNLENMVNEGQFRLDLFYRLNVVNIRVPSLRERREDIPVLAKYLMEKISEKEGIRVDGISFKALDFLKNYDWPGNVRELENTLERAINFMDDETRILAKHLPPKITGISSYDSMRTLKETLEEVEKDVILNRLILAKGNKSEAAETLGISRTSLYDKLTKYNIEA
ncbi:sigma-54 interaction domain-containing protein [Gudongella oleilytica]|jgi:transcriptional regulator with PAS, ATPase and Fis domain|uniref:sigma-54 interaction domain-containing protein n=1 Tax=Gudongella oleilytica TaxID=1582259 RepID=UPI0019D1A1C7|nr:sigma 54-interacting transcriptional regulator [Gudongella oleilytica]